MNSRSCTCGVTPGGLGINAQVDDPFYGFNRRLDACARGGHGRSIFHQFERPLLRLILDQDDRLLVEGSQADFLDHQDDRGGARGQQLQVG